MEAHLEMQVEANVRRGMSPEAARRAAILESGGIEVAKDRYRDQRGLPWLETFVRDVRFALRGMRNNPGFAAVVVASLALGVGATTAVFSVVDAILLRPLPYREPERLVMLELSPARR